MEWRNWRRKYKTIFTVLLWPEIIIILSLRGKLNDMHSLQFLRNVNIIYCKSNQALLSQSFWLRYKDYVKQILNDQGIIWMNNFINTPRNLVILTAEWSVKILVHRIYSLYGGQYKMDQRMPTNYTLMTWARSVIREVLVGSRTGYKPPSPPTPEIPGVSHSRVVCGEIDFSGIRNQEDD